MLTMKSPKWIILARHWLRFQIHFFSIGLNHSYLFFISHSSSWLSLQSSASLSPTRSLSLSHSHRKLGYQESVCTLIPGCVMKSLMHTHLTNTHTCMFRATFSRVYISTMRQLSTIMMTNCDEYALCLTKIFYIKKCTFLIESDIICLYYLHFGVVFIFGPAVKPFKCAIPEKLTHFSSVTTAGRERNTFLIITSMCCNISPALQFNATHTHTQTHFLSLHTIFLIEPFGNINDTCDYKSDRCLAWSRAPRKQSYGWLKKENKEKKNCYIYPKFE